MSRRRPPFQKRFAALIGGMLLFVMVGALKGTENLNLRPQSNATEIGLVKTRVGCFSANICSHSK